MIRLLGIFVFAISIAFGQSNPDPRFITEDIPFSASCDGTEQRYVRMLPIGLDPIEQHDVLIALHGHGSNRWQFAVGEFAEGIALRDGAVERSMILVLPDYRATTSWMGPKAESDVVQIIGAVRNDYRVERVFISGASMGGASSLTFAALHPELVAGVISMNGTANHLEYEQFQDAIQESFGGTKAEIPEEYKRRSAEYWPERFTMPVGITASGKDTLVPPESVLRLADVLKKLDRRVLLIYRPDDGHSTRLEDARDIFDYVLATALPGAE